MDSCPADARIFGNLNDENSAPSKLLAKYPAEVLQAHKGTKPKVFYIRKFNKLYYKLGDINIQNSGDCYLINGK